MTKRLNEDNLAEQPVISWLKEEGYDYEFGPELAFDGIKPERKDYREVLILPRLKRAIRQLNPDISDNGIDEVVYQLSHASNPDLELLNKDVFKMLVQGVKIEDKNKSGERKTKLVQLFDFENPLSNEFLAVNQYAIQGSERVRRPDVLVFINGIPVALFELKSPTSTDGTVRSAYKQIQYYKKDIPELFKYNQILIISDLLRARHGTISSSWEWFGTWKGIESEDEKHAADSELEVLAKGIFHKARLLDIIKNFIVFEADSEKDAAKYTKKMCMYHQYYGVNKVINETVNAVNPKSSKKIGVFWHTQGSGKSLSMVFYINKAKITRELKSPTFVFLTDRNDLDGQLYKTFLRTGYDKIAKQASSVADLKERLRGAGAEMIFTTIQKFEGEAYDELSDRDNIIVIADEAHRSQYAKLAGNVRKALPGASFLGITGTPVSLNNRDTRLVFGDLISTYPMDRAVQDGATVKIYYEGRLVPLHLTNEFIDEEYEDLMAEHPVDLKEDYKKKFARLEQAVGSEDRLKKIADDIVEHFNNRQVEGKAMVVTISRRVATRMYELISQNPKAPEVAVVFSKTDEFRDRIQKETDSKELAARFKKASDPLKIVIVCDMWLTGFDVPSMTTMYIDKPLRNHTLIQAIARVNRVFKDKQGGLIVDYIGIADNLKKALSIYASNVQKEAMIPIAEVIAKMEEKYGVVRQMFAGASYGDWKKLKPVELARLFNEAVNMVITDKKTGALIEENKKRFLEEVGALLKLFAFAMPHKEALDIRTEVEFFAAVRRAIIKLTIVDPPGGPDEDTESIIRELISKSIAAEGIIDIFALKNKAKPDISIFDDKFMEEVKKMGHANVAIEVLRKLLKDEISIRMKTNLFRYQSLLEMLQDIIEQYENNMINSSKVIEKLIALAKEIKQLESHGRELGLSDEEMAFYDALSSGKKGISKNGELKALVKELVSVIKRDLTVDWTDNDVIKSRIRANVRMLLLRSGIADEDAAEEQMMEMIFRQATSLYGDFSSAAYL